jgi:hypothetical protein
MIADRAVVLEESREAEQRFWRFNVEIILSSCIPVGGGDAGPFGSQPTRGRTALGDGAASPALVHD